MDARVARLVNRTGIVNAAIGVVLSPIPLADELIMFPIFGWMTKRIAEIHALPPERVPWKAIRNTRIAALAARAAVNVTVSFIPGVAAVANAISAFAITEVVGTYVDRICADPEHAEGLTMQEMMETLRDRLRRRRQATATPATAAGG